MGRSPAPGGRPQKLLSALLLACALVVAAAAPALAGTHTGNGRVTAQADPDGSGHVACGNWGLRLDTNAAGYYFHLKSSNSTLDGTYPSCPDAFGLPSNRSKTRVRGYHYESGLWVLRLTSSLEGNTSGASYVPAEIVTVDVPEGYWYPEGGHDITLWTQAYYESGGTGMGDYYDNPYV